MCSLWKNSAFQQGRIFSCHLRININFWYFYPSFFRGKFQALDSSIWRLKHILEFTLDYICQYLLLFKSRNNICYLSRENTHFGLPRLVPVSTCCTGIIINSPHKLYESASLFLGQYTDNYNWKEERFILAHRFSEFSPLSAFSETEMAWQNDMMGENCSLPDDQEAEKDGTGEKNTPFQFTSPVTHPSLPAPAWWDFGGRFWSKP